MSRGFTVFPAVELWNCLFPSCSLHHCDQKVARPSIITGTMHAHPPAPFHLHAGGRPSIRWRLLLGTRPVDSIASVRHSIARGNLNYGATALSIKFEFILTRLRFYRYCIIHLWIFFVFFFKYCHLNGIVVMLEILPTENISQPFLVTTATSSHLAV